MKNHLLTLMLSCLLINGFGQEAAKLNFSAPLFFVENIGQVHDQHGDIRTDIDYKLTVAPGLNIFVGAGQIHYQFSKRIAKGVPVRREKQGFPLKFRNDSCAGAETKYRTCRLDMTLEGANTRATAETEDTRQYCESYYQPGVCRDDATAHAYGGIIYRNIYPGIDWRFYLKNGSLEYDFIVHPGGNVNDIKIEYSGATNMTAVATTVNVLTPLGGVAENNLYCYQQETGRQVPANFKNFGGVLGLQVGPYRGTLIIDPRLVWGTYLGTGTPSSEANGLSIDAAGNLCVTGSVYSDGNLATSGAFDTVIGGGGPCAFLAKLLSNGSMSWCTYFGAKSTQTYALTTDKSNNIYIAGYTTCDTGIATIGAFKTNGGANNAFVAKFSTTGQLLWGTYYGCDSTQINSLACDNSGNLFAAGNTACTDSFATDSAYQASYGGNWDAFLTKFSSTGDRLWATYFGGDSLDQGNAVACDDSGRIYFTGLTGSHTGIATPGAYQRTYSGAFDIFLACFSNSGSIRWGTYYGGSGIDASMGISADTFGNIFVSGITASAAGIATAGAYMSHFNDISFRVPMLARFANTGQLIWGTYFGVIADFAFGNAVDKLGNVYLTGGTRDTDSIATPDGYQRNFEGNQDAYIAKFDTSGALVWGTYYNGSGASEGNCVACDRSGNFYMYGATNSPDGIATLGTFNDSIEVDTIDGDINLAGFIAKFDSLETNGVTPIAKPSLFNMEVYPGPASEILTVNVFSALLCPDEGTLILTDVLGRILLRTSLTMNVPRLLSVSGIPTGVYFVSCFINSYISSKKIIITH